MPGLNQRGPEGMGPMTGRQTGRCVNPACDAGGGFGARRGGRGMCRAGGLGRGAGLGRGRGYTPAAAPVDPGAALKERARILEEELAAVKAQLGTATEPE